MFLKIFSAPIISSVDRHLIVALRTTPQGRIYAHVVLAHLLNNPAAHSKRPASHHETQQAQGTPFTVHVPF